MATHFDPYPNDDEGQEQAVCGTVLGDVSKLSSCWTDVNCKSCLKRKAPINAARAAEELAIVSQMGDMAAFMKKVKP